MQCPLCPLKFSYRSEYDKHRFKVHEGKGLDVKKKRKSPKKFPCNLCSRVFQTQFDVKNHVAIHEGKKLENQKPSTNLSQNTIDMLDPSFKAKYNVDQDYSPNNSVHEKEKFKCSICSKVYSAKATLKKHIFKMHEKTLEKTMPYQCPFCPLRFGYRNDFDKHLMKVHVGEELSNQDAYQKVNDMLNNSNSNQDVSELILPD